ncbi:MAG: hypothetical protein Q9225_000667, partial [Loekoesia sp. 1 TL-2023]
MTHDKMEALRADWKKLYGKTLPSLALSKSPAQGSWPVHVDHCFGRIIMDNAVGKNEPWMNKLKSPAAKNMTSEQLEKCIALGNAIADGKENLVELDARSLQLRGKKQKPAANSKRKRDAPDEEVQGKTERPTSKKRQLDIKSAFSPSKQEENHPPSPPAKSSSPAPQSSSKPNPIDPDLHKLITTSDLTPFRQRALLALCQVPRGHFTTYAALSAHL